jgi:hypothetical protein
LSSALDPYPRPSTLLRTKLWTVALVSLLSTWLAWAAFDPLPLVEDEYSYVLQSRIFATGRWTAPSPPAPDFFQQAHVLTVPAVASKYPPGHALLMTPGTLLGLPALVPLILTAITGALIFALATRVANEWVGWFAWLAWLADPISLRFRAAYYSEVTSSAMWILSLWALLEWRESRRTQWLVVVAAAIGWGAITRPITMLAFAIPVGVVVIRDVVAHRLWRDIVLSMAVGTAIVGIVPLWSAKTTGNWRLTPHTLYSRDYLPYDHPGFGIDTTKPRRPLTAPNRFTYAGFYDEHMKHTPANLPGIAFARLKTIARQEWPGPHLILVPFVLLGLTAISAEVLFALVCSMALFVGYLSYGHWVEWTLYYFEALPILSALAGLGLWRVAGWLHDRDNAKWPMYAACGIVALLAAYETREARIKRIRAAEWDTAFRSALAKIPFPAAVIFVHYAPRLGPHASVVANSPDIQNEPIWIVNDLGVRNPELMRVAGNRMPLAFYEDGQRFEVDRSLLPAR